MTETIIAACGNDCAACPRYTAHPYEKTDEELHRTAELWMKIGYRDHVVSNEEIACHGCKPENWCRYRVIKCCVDRGIKTCAECFGYPCENIKECFEVTKSFEPMCRQVCTDEEYKRPEKAFFENEKNLSDKRVKLDPVQKEDIELLWRMQVEAFTDLLDKYQDFEMSPAAESIDKVIARFEQPWTKYYFIIAGRIKVGAIRVVDKQDGSRKRISPIWIMPEYRNKGYAQQAILAAEKIYGSDHWCLDTILQEEGNIHLYEKLGYHQTGRVDKINDRMEIVYYEKDIGGEFDEACYEGDGLGYDIRVTVLLPEKHEMRIEVKTTKESYVDGFYLTPRELNAARQCLDDETSKKVTFYIYRIYNFDATKKTANIKIYEGFDEENFRLAPTCWKVHIR